MNEALLVKILRTAAIKSTTYQPEDHKISSLRGFQLMVETAQQAQAEGLIRASFQMPSQGKITAGLIRSFIVTEITRQGLERLVSLRSRPSAKPPPPPLAVGAALSIAPR